MKRIFSFFMLVAFSVSLVVKPVSAFYEGKSYLYNDYSESIPAPPAFSTAEVLDGNTLKVGNLSDPKDLFVDVQNNIYIADSGNNRILVFDSNWNLKQMIDKVTNSETESFSNPSGIFADRSGELYVCDTGNQRVLHLDKNNSVIKELTMPKTELIDQDSEFKPEKVVVDSTGTVYVVAYGIYQGIIEYNADGGFSSFFGSNRVELTIEVLAMQFWKSIFSKEQREALTRTIPTEYANLYIDPDNFIYAVTSKTENSLDEVKKLNALGANIIRFPKSNTLYDKNNYGDLEVNYEKGTRIDSSIVDVHADTNGVITLLDATRCRIFQYDQESNLLFIFGAPGDQSGTFRKPSAVEKCNGKYLVLDEMKGTITVLTYTDYAQKVLYALSYYREGKYIEAVALWEDVLQHNSHLSLAYMGIGKAYLQQEHYEEALKYLEKSNDRQGYSNALREYRKQFVRDHIVWIILLAVAVITALVLLIRKLKIVLGFAAPRKNR